MKKKQEVWTKRCTDGRACAPVDREGVKKLGKRALNKEAKAGYPNFRMMDQTHYIPDSQDICDSCLAAKYDLDLYSSDCCCSSFEGYSKEEVLAALRKAEAQ